MSDSIFRLRVGYKKEGRLRHLGHLEVLRTVERCVRRAGLPFAVTQGFSPHMRVQFSSALPTGVLSSCECYDVFLTDLVDLGRAHENLVRATPVDLAPFAVCYATRQEPALESWLTRARWEVLLPDGRVEADALRESLAGLVSSGGFDYMRGDKPKHADLTTTLVSCDVSGRQEGVLLTLDTRSGAMGALRPSALVRAALEPLGASDAVPFVRRCGQWHEEEDGTLSSPFPTHVGWPS